MCSTLTGLDTLSLHATAANSLANALEGLGTLTRLTRLEINSWLVAQGRHAT